MRSVQEIVQAAVAGIKLEGNKLTIDTGLVIPAVIRAQALDRLTDAVLELAYATRPPVVSVVVREAMLTRGREEAERLRKLIVPEGVDLEKDVVTADLTLLPVNQKPMSFDGPIKVLPDTGELL